MFLKHLIKALIINLVLISLVFVLHNLFPSVINNLNQTIALSWDRIDDQYLATYWGFHNGHPVFAGRAITTFAIATLVRSFPFSFGTSFVLVNFGSLFLCGILIYWLAWLYRLKDASLSVSKKSSIIFFTSFSIIFAFFRPISTFDEPLQYVGILLTLVCIHFKKYWWGIVPLTFAMLCRETTAFLYPGFMVMIFYRAFFDRVVLYCKKVFRIRNVNTPLPPSRGDFVGKLTNPPLEGGRGVFNLSAQSIQVNSRFNSHTLSKITLFIIPLIVYSIVTPLILKSKAQLEAAGTYLTHDRWVQWRYNFHDFQYTFESFVSAILVLGLPLVGMVVYRRLFSFSSEQKRLVWAGYLTLAINTPLVFALALAQEARLFALPLLFWWPILGNVLWEVFRYAFKHIRDFWKLKVLVLFFSIPLFYFISFHWYRPTFSGGFGWAYQTYVFVELVLISFLVVSICKRLKPNI